MAIRLASQCCDAVKRHVDLVYSDLPFVGGLKECWDIVNVNDAPSSIASSIGDEPSDYAYVVLNDNETHALAMITIDRNSILVTWGSSRAAIRAIVRHAACTVDDLIEWAPFGDESEVGRAIVVSTVDEVLASESPRHASRASIPHLPGLHVVSAPTNKHHLLMIDASGQAREEPHIVAEVGIVMEECDEPAEWHTCIVTSSLRFEPPVVCWWDMAKRDQFTDRTLRVRFRGVDLLPPGIVRVGRLVCTYFYQNCWRMSHYEEWGVEAIERIAYPSLTYYPDITRAVELLSAQITVVSVRAARLIQRAWRRAVSDPAYDVCMRRLSREFDEGLPA